MNHIKLKYFDTEKIYDEIHESMNVTTCEARMLLRTIHECDFMEEGYVYYMIKHYVDVGDVLVNLATIANIMGHQVTYDITTSTIDICNATIRVVSADSDRDDIYKINRTKDVVFYSSTLVKQI